MSNTDNGDSPNSNYLGPLVFFLGGSLAEPWVCRDPTQVDKSLCKVVPKYGRRNDFQSVGGQIVKVENDTWAPIKTGVLDCTCAVQGGVWWGCAPSELGAFLKM